MHNCYYCSCESLIIKYSSVFPFLSLLVTQYNNEVDWPRNRSMLDYWRELRVRNCMFLKLVLMYEFDEGDESCGPYFVHFFIFLYLWNPSFLFVTKH